MEIELIVVDFENQQQSADFCYLLECYATDPMGGNTPLPAEVKENLATELSKLPSAISVICYIDGKPAGLVNCFKAFSTFRCKPLINIHDVIVESSYRGLGISQLMLAKVEEIAKEHGCCKLTLEVLEGNEIAQRSYSKFGFAGYQLDPRMGKALFWQKTIEHD